MKENNTGTLSISEVSEKYKLSQDTLRYYERIGVLPPVYRNNNGIRRFRAQDLKWVELVVGMRQVGLPIEVLAEYVKLSQAGRRTVSARLNLLQEHRNSLQKQKDDLERMLNDVENTITSFTMEIRDK